MTAGGTHLVKLLERLDVHQRSRVVEDPEPVVDPQSWTQRRAEEVSTVGTPLAVTRVGRVKRADLLERLAIPNVDLPSEVAESSDAQEATLGVVGEEVARVGSKVVDDFDFLVKDDGLGGHDCSGELVPSRRCKVEDLLTSVGNGKLAIVRGPSKVVNTSLLVCGRSRAVSDRLGSSNQSRDSPKVTRQSKVPAADIMYKLVSP